MHDTPNGATHPAKGKIKLWWGREGADADPLAPGVTHSPPSLFDPVKGKQMFRAGGLVSEAGVVERTALHDFVRTLARRINAEKASLGTIPENDTLPSGYTYLLQLIAHDMVDTAISPSLLGQNLGAAFENFRSRPLRLDTLYGAGPDQCRHAYARGRMQAEAHGNLPRNRLRLGAVNTQLSPGDFCPRRDIARGERPRSVDPANEVDAGVLSEPQLADARNDGHAFNSQITVLFQLLHNHVLDLLEQEVRAQNKSERELAYPLFLCARSVVEVIYRHIIEKDVLPRILDRRILDRYRERKPLWTSPWQGVPREFSFGAFRFAHTISRDKYVVNKQSLGNGLNLGGALIRSGTRSPSRQPMQPEWLVDWVHFFEFGRHAKQKTNFSNRIGPHYPRDLSDDTNFPGKAGVDEPGLASRDLLSACMSGLLSVPWLTSKLQKVFGADIIPDYASTWPAEIKRWLAQGPHGGVQGPMSDRIAADPPLPFFVMFEAQHTGAPKGECLTVERRDGGQAQRIAGKHLGPLGSAIVAETFFAALSASSFDFERSHPRLEDRIRNCVNAVLDPNLQADAVEALTKGLPPLLTDIATMPALLNYLKAKQVF